jgi:hypothetical protein
MKSNKNRKWHPGCQWYSWGNSALIFLASYDKELYKLSSWQLTPVVTVVMNTGVKAQTSQSSKQIYFLFGSPLLLLGICARNVRWWPVIVCPRRTADHTVLARGELITMSPKNLKSKWNQRVRKTRKTSNRAFAFFFNRKQNKTQQIHELGAGGSCL